LAVWFCVLISCTVKKWKYLNIIHFVRDLTTFFSVFKKVQTSANTVHTETWHIHHHLSHPMRKNCENWYDNQYHCCIVIIVYYALNVLECIPMITVGWCQKHAGWIKKQYLYVHRMCNCRFEKKVILQATFTDQHKTRHWHRLADNQLCRSHQISNTVFFCLMSFYAVTMFIHSDINLNLEFN
jgi:hypothetical protein